ncbi:hypothetical protein pEaSNUABM23_00323 [Erwinia phage pEa_SNUABM_23]|nr:hypothetical protein pEaSNUABM23_00323 [Erwinia phage pEa_SNUABM_23]UIW11000.1 hypothetical protein pEaSNUABM23_00323 [Erwinia phage pEa_SNUABM_31]
MTQEVDHGANIVQMITSRDDKIRELTESNEQTAGRNEDVEAELQELSRDHLALKIKLRSTEREHTAEIALRDERIREVVGFCNEQSQQIRELQAELESVKNSQTPMSVTQHALHTIMTAGVSKYHAIVAQLSQHSVNNDSNKSRRAINTLYQTDTVTAHPSMYRAIARYVNASGSTLPSVDALRKAIRQYIVDNHDLFYKDAEYELSRLALREVWVMKRNPAHLGFAARNICQAFDWLPAAYNDDLDMLDDESEYEDLFVDSVAKICTHLIDDSFK